MVAPQIIAAAAALFLQTTPALAGCAAGERVLDGTGLCQSQAEQMLPPASASFVEGLVSLGCRAVINDAQIPGGDAILFWGAQCGGDPVSLEVGFGAHSGSLSVISGGLRPVGQDVLQEVATVLLVDANDPKTVIDFWAKDAMRGQGFDAAYIATCAVRPDPIHAWDGYVVDEINPPAFSDGPRDACGPFGYTEDATSYWRILGQYALFFEFGQDANHDFDANTMIFVPRARFAAAPRLTAAAQTFGAHNYGVVNIAGKPGVRETTYGWTRGYTVYAGASEATQGYCVAERNFGGSLLRIGFDGGQWQLAVQSEVKPDYYGQIMVDNRTQDITGTAANGWAFAWVGQPVLHAVRNGSLMILDIGRASYDFPLDGSAAAILKVKECVANGGIPGAVATAAPATPTAVENDAYRIVGNCPPLYPSPVSDQPAVIEFVDRIASGQAASVYWIDFDGNPVEMGIFDNGRLILNSYVGHGFIVKDFGGTCYGGRYVAGSGHTRFEVR